MKLTNIVQERPLTNVEQTWNLSKNLHRWIFRLKILHHQFYLISTVLVRKKHKKWVKMEKFTQLAKILHCRRHWRHWQIPPLLGELVGRAWNICKLCLKWWWMQSASRSAPLPPPRPPLCKYLYIWILSLNIISIFETIFIFGHYPCTNVHYLYIFILEDCLLLHDNFIAPKASAEGACILSKMGNY